MNLRGNGNTLAHYYRALSYKEQGNKTKAIAELEKIVSHTNDQQWIIVARQEIEELSK